ncbi:MAG: T9SS type A sorting domain-containing protein [Bacteroidetes bacterium]|nr:T9SS type A sorting domain-containing protein [Bacteroidota bacterium]
MKKLFGVLICSVSVTAFNQSLTPTVVASSGDFFSGSAASLSWTLGEVVTDTYIGTNNQLTQGFQQPEIRFLTVEDLAVEITMNLYPNPTTSEVSLEIKNNTETLSILIHDVTGKLMYNGLYQPETIQKIDLSTYANGIYLMQINNSKNEKLKTVKIQKS